MGLGGGGRRRLTAQSGVATMQQFSRGCSAGGGIVWQSARGAARGGSGARGSTEAATRAAPRRQALLALALLESLPAALREVDTTARWRAIPTRAPPPAAGARGSWQVPCAPPTNASALSTPCQRRRARPRTSPLQKSLCSRGAPRVLARVSRPPRHPRRTCRRARRTSARLPRRSDRRPRCRKPTHTGRSSPPPRRQTRPVTTSKMLGRSTEPVTTTGSLSLRIRTTSSRTRWWRWR